MGEEICPFSWQVTPHEGGDHALFEHFSSPQGRRLGPFSTFLLPAAAREHRLVDLVVGSNQENGNTSYFMVGSIPQKLSTSYPTNF